MLHQTVFKLVMGRVGSRCLDLPKGNRYHSGRVIPNRRVYQREWFSSAGNRTEFKGIVRPSPASVLLLPTVRNCFSKSTCTHVRLRISASRIPAFRASVKAA